MKRAIIISLLPVLLLASCKRNEAHIDIRDSKLPKVSVTPSMFVGTASTRPPRIDNLHGAFLVRMELSPEDIPETRVIAETCRSGGAVIATIHDISFLICGVSDSADALTIVPTRERALKILHALEIPPENIPF